MNRHKLGLPAATLMAAAVLSTACGGGGGGGAPVPPVPPPQPPPSDTTFGTLAIDQNNADALPLAISLSEAALAFTQTAINAMVLYSSDAVRERDCGNTGTLSVAHQDLDSSFDISPGDIVTISLTDCYDRVVDGIGNGTVDVSISAFMLASDMANIAGSLLTPSPVTIADRNDPTLIATVAADHTFSFSLQSPEVLTIAANGSQGLTAEIDGISESISDFTVTKTAERIAPGSAAANVNTDTTFDVFYDSTLLGGSFSCESGTIAFVGGADVPNTSSVLCRGLNRSAVRVTDSNEVQVDPEGDGSFATLGTLDWGVTLDGFMKTDSGLILADLVSSILLRTIALQSNDVIYDQPRDRLLIATSAQDPVNPDALLAVSVSNNSTSTLLSFDDEPAAVRLSSDGAVAYVSFTGLGEIRSYDVATMQPGAVLTVESDQGISNEFAVVDFEPSPVDVDRLAVAFRFVGTDATDIVVFDGIVQQPSTYRDASSQQGPPVNFDLLEFSADGLRLFTTKTGSTAAGILTLNNSGVVSSAGVSSMFGGKLQRVGNRLMNGERVLDADTLVRVGSFVGALANASAIDETNGIALDVRQEVLRVYDSDTYVPLATYRLAVNPDTDFVGIVPAGGAAVLVAGDLLRLIDIADIETMNTGVCDALALSTSDNEPYTRYDCPVTDAVYDSVRGKIYAAVDSTLGVNGNSIAVIDADQGSVENYVSIASDPRQIAMSPDGSKLFAIYTGADLLTTVDLNTLSVSRTQQIDVASSPQSPDTLRPQNALRIAASTLDNDAVVLSLGEPTSSPFERLTVFKDGTRLSDELFRADLQGSQGNNGPQVIFDAGGLAYSLSDNFDSATLQSLSIGQDGLAAGAFFEVTNVEVGAGSSDVYLNEVFTPLGSVIDLVDQTGTMRYDTRAPSFDDARGGLAVVVDAPSNEVFVLVGGGSGAGVGRYALGTGAFIGEQQLDAFSASFFEETLIDLPPDKLGIVASPNSGLIVIDKSAVQ